MRVLILALALAACRVPDVTFTGTGGDGGGSGTDGGSGSGSSTCALALPTPPLVVTPNGGSARFEPVGIATGLFDGDTKADFAVIGLNASRLEVFGGTGAGRFAPLSSLTVVSTPTAISIANIDNDGKPDLVIYGPSTGARAYLGDGTGGFTAASAAATPMPHAPVIADLNGDHADDAVAFNQANVNVTVYYGNPSGTFTAQTPIPLSETPQALALGDINPATENGPGIDIVVASTNGAQSHIYSALRASNSYASFGGGTGFAAGAGTPIALALADVTGDQKLDAIATTTMGLQVFPNLGMGTFDTPMLFGTMAGRSLDGLAVGDLDNDGDADVVATSSATMQLLVFANHGGLAAPKTYTVAYPGTPSIVDIDGDGNGDVLVSNTANDTVEVFLGAGDGTLRAPREYGVPAQPTDLAVGDLDGNGHPDLVVANGADHAAFLADGTGLVQATVVGPPGGDAIALGALRSGGPLDYVDLRMSGAKIFEASLGNGSGDFAGSMTLVAAPAHIPSDLTLAPIDAIDGDDLVSLDQSNRSVSVYAGNGAGEVSIAGTTTICPTGMPYGIVAAQLDADTHLDVATACRDDDAVSVLVGHGDGTFTSPAIPSPVTGGPSFLAIADLDGDHHPDIALALDELPAVAVLHGNGTDGFTDQVDYPTSDHVYEVAIGDVDGDGLPDLVAVTGFGVDVLLQQSDHTFAPALLFAAGVVPTHVVVADFNGDGFADIAVTDGNMATLFVLARSACAP